MNQIFRFLLLFSFVLSVSSCINEEQSKAILLDDMELSQFKDIDFTDLQKTIDSRNDITNGVDALHIFYPKDENEGAGNNTTTKSVKNKYGSNYLFFKQENLSDDALQSIAFWMEYKTTSTGKIVILDFKQSFKCKDGRGHFVWDGEPCK